MWQAKHLITLAGDPESTKLVLGNDSGDETECTLNFGHTFRFDNQYFDPFGREIMLPENVKSVDRYVTMFSDRSSNSIVPSEIFWGTTKDGELILVKKQIDQKMIRQEPPAFKLYIPNLVSAEAINAEGTILEKLDFYKNTVNGECAWIILKANVYGEDRYKLYNLEKRIEIGFNVFRDRASLIAEGRPLQYWGQDRWLADPPKFYQDADYGYMMSLKYYDAASGKEKEVFTDEEIMSRMGERMYLDTYWKRRG